MKQSWIILLLALLTLNCWSAGIIVEIDGRSNKVTFTEPKGLPVVYPVTKPETKDYYMEFRAPAKAPAQWETVEISFIPSAVGSVVLGFSGSNDRQGGMTNWIDIDNIQITNAVLHNTSFEQLNELDEFFSWRYYSKSTEKRDKTDAVDGKNYVSIAGHFPIRQSFRIRKAGDPVVIRFSIRAGGLTKIPADYKKFTSHNYAKRASSVSVMIGD